MTAARIERLDPSRYRRTPWRNGGGVTVDVALGLENDDEIWRFGRTPIVQPGPFSDYAGFDRVQVLVAGSGLVLETPQGEIDVRQPFRPVRFAGETPVVSRLEAGAVEVVNLIGRRDRVQVDIAVLDEGRQCRLGQGTHFAYNPRGDTVLLMDGVRQTLGEDHALRIDVSESSLLAGITGCLLVASITPAASQQRG